MAVTTFLLIGLLAAVATCLAAVVLVGSLVCIAAIVRAVLFTVAIVGERRRRGGPGARARNRWQGAWVEQGHYGHHARKATWLYYVGENPPPELIWGPSQGQRLDEGFHSKEERAAARAAGIKPRKRLSRAQNIATPIPFRDLLLSIARGAR